MKRLFCLLIIMLFLAPPAALPWEDVYELAPITITGELETAADGNVDWVDIKGEENPVVSLVPDVLEKTVGLDVQRRSIMTPKGSQVKIRGFDERRSLIMLDGRPLNGAGVMGGQFVDWSVLSVGNWESIAVGKGAFSARYGNTLGGTINLIPKKPGKESVFHLTAGGKRYDTYSGRASASGTFGDMAVRFAGGYMETDGNLRNSGAERADFAGDLYYFWGGDGEAKVGIRYTDGEFEMPVRNAPGLDGYDPSFPDSIGAFLNGPWVKFPNGDRHGDGSRYTKERTELDLSLKKTVAGVDSEVKLYYNNEDREDTIYSNDSKTAVLKRECTPDRSWGWAARMEKALGAHRVGGGLEGNYLGYGGVDNTFVAPGFFNRPPSDGPDEWDATRWHGAYIDDKWAASDRLDLYFGLRFEDYYGDRMTDKVTGYVNGKPAGFERISVEFDEETLLPKFGVVYRPVDGLSLFGRYARATRFPDNPAFYWYYGGYRPEVDPSSTVVRGNLTYEDAHQYEVGISYKLASRLMASLSYYYYEVDDYIRWIFGYSPSRVVYNIDQVEFQGIEADVEGRLWGNMFAFANLTWQETQKKGDVLDGANSLSDELPELPDLKGNLGIKYEKPGGILAKATLRWVDDRRVPFFSDKGMPDGAPAGRPVVLKHMSDFTVVDVFFRFPVLKTRTKAYLTTGIENLFDENYEEEYGFPSPAQTFHIGAEITFH